MYTSTMNENRIEFVYFKRKLGISFKIVDGKVMVVGADNGGTLATIVSGSRPPSTCDLVPTKELNNDEKEKQKSSAEMLSTALSSPATPQSHDSLTKALDAAVKTPVNTMLLPDNEADTTVFLGEVSTYGELASFTDGSATLSINTETAADTFRVVPSSGKGLTINPYETQTAAPVLGVESPYTPTSHSSSKPLVPPPLPGTQMPPPMSEELVPLPSAVPESSAKLVSPGHKPPPPFMPKSAPPPPPPRKSVTESSATVDSAVAGAAPQQTSLLPPVPSTPPPPPPIALLEPEEDLSKLEVFKIIIESESLFGAGIKKVLKTVLPPATSKVTSKARIAKLSAKITETLELTLPPSEELLLNYFDEDVADYVVLDGDSSWEEFQLQTKKLMKISTLPAKVTRGTTEPLSMLNPGSAGGASDASYSAAVSSLAPPPPPPPVFGSPSQLQGNKGKPLPPPLVPGTPLSPIPSVDSKQQQQQPQQQQQQPLSSSAAAGSNPFALTPVLKRVPSNRPISSTTSLVATGAAHTLKNIIRRALSGSLSKAAFPEGAAAVTGAGPQCSAPSKQWILCTDEPYLNSIVLYINGVKVSDLDKDFQLALVKQKTRPLLIEFQLPSQQSSREITLSRATAVSDASELSVPGDGKGAEKTEKGGGNPAKMKNSFFMSKYMHSTAFKLRGKVEKLLQDYQECDWAAARKNNTGLPYTTLTSIYRYIESEMVHTLELFNNKRTRGVGSPDEITEAYLEDLREHIEAMVFNSVAGYTKSLWPIFRDDREKYEDFEDENETSGTGSGGGAAGAVSKNEKLNYLNSDGVTSLSANTTSGLKSSSLDAELSVPELSSEHSLHMKMAYLRFVTFENLGLKLDEKHTSGGGPLQRMNSNESGEVETNHPSNAAAPPTPAAPSSSSAGAAKDVFENLRLNAELCSKEEWYLAMKGVCRAMQFETPSEVLSRLVSTAKLISHALNAYINMKRESDVDLACINCGRVHLKSPEGVTTDGLADTEVAALSENSCLMCSAAQNKETNPETSSGSSSSSTSGVGSHTIREISADDLMPAITWVVIQANPSNIEYILWLCGAFRHPQLLKGEEAYYLAQMSSAVEFIRNAKVTSFDIPRDTYNYHMARYNNTLKLLIACKLGKLRLVQSLLHPEGSAATVVPADINGRTPDNKDTPLTACIKFGQLEIFHYLIEQPDLQVDTLVNLYSGPNQRSTALMIAVEFNSIECVLCLLNRGANRYHSNDNNHTAVNIATKKELKTIEILLGADPSELELVTAIEGKAEKLVAGLLLQSVEVNYLMPPQLLVSPLIAAVQSLHVEVVRMLISCHEVSVNVNYCNCQGETALIVCALLIGQSSKPAPELVIIAAMLLRAGADRYLVDQTGRTALEHLNQAIAAKAAAAAAAKASTTTATGGSTPGRVALNRSTSSSSAHHTSVEKALLEAEALADLESQKKKTGGDRSIVGDPTIEMKHLLMYDPKKDNLTLHEIVKNGDFLGCKSLLYQGVDVNVMDPVKGYNAIIAAVYNRDMNCLNLLVRAGEIFNLTNGYRPSHWFDEMNYEAEPVSPGGVLRKTSNELKLDQAGRGGMTALHYAAQLGDTSIVGRLLQVGARRDVVNDKRHTPLDVAVANGHIEAANALRFDPETVSICLAAKHGDWLVMKALLCQGVSINTVKQHVSAKGIHHELYTPLIAAAAHGQLETMKMMLQMEDVNVDQVNLIGQTALMYAAARGDESSVLALLNKGADRWIKDAAGNDAAYWSEKRGFTNLTVLLKHDPMRIFIHDVIRKNDFPAVVAMLKQRVSPNLTRRAVFLMLPPSVDVSAFASEAYETSSLLSTNSSASAAQKHSSTHKQAAELGLIEGETPLIVASKYNRMEVLALLLKSPEIEINMTDAQGWTALHHAAVQGNESAVLLLIKSGISRTALDKSGKSAQNVATAVGQLQIAAIIEADPYCVHIHDMCEKGKLLMISALLKQGCPPNYRDERLGMLKQTPLMAACSGGKADAVKMLLRSESVVEGIDDVDTQGLTALMRAAKAGALDCTALLLNVGADRNLKDNEGLTARDHAARHSFSVMFQFISQNMVR